MPSGWQETVIGAPISEDSNQDAIDTQVGDHKITETRVPAHDSTSSTLNRLPNGRSCDAGAMRPRVGAHRLTSGICTKKQKARDHENESVAVTVSVCFHNGLVTPVQFSFCLKFNDSTGINHCAFAGFFRGT
jgi:hypothetical protein